MRTFLLSVISILSLALTPMSGKAHNVGVACKLDGGMVRVEAYYDDDTAAAKAKVKVVNASDETIANGITDDKGIWSFTAPPVGKYVVHVDAGAGHRARTTLEVKGGVQVPDKAVTPMKASREPIVSTSVSTASEGPSRDEFTRMPWVKISIGMTVIGGLGGAFLLASRLRRNGKSNGI